MYQSALKESVKVYTKQYSGFAGVDFSSAITEVDDKRSPDAVNMIADLNGFPQKRTGYETITDALLGRVNGIFNFRDENNSAHTVVHAGTKLFEMISGVPSEIFSGANNTRSSAFPNSGKLYILDGANYIVFDGSTAKKVEGHTPTTVISASPTGGGTDYENINLISQTRINQFLGEAGVTEYQLDAKSIDAVIKAEILSSSGEWVETTAYTVNTNTGVVTFATAPGAPTVEGADNVRITFSKYISDNEAKIRGCTIYATYGQGNDTRVFVSGNEKLRNMDWCSGFNDPTYFPDTGYSMIGSDGSAIMGYLKQYESLVIVKEKSECDATLYLRSVSENSAGETIFPVTQGLSGVGAVSKHCFSTLYDDNVFLSSDGVFGLDTSKISLQRTTQQRSKYINGRLLKEDGLFDAVACVWNGYYCLFVNGHVYLADSRQQTSNGMGSFGYEWYYWTDIPARVVKEIEGRLYFGTADGKLCAFKKESESFMDAYSDDGEAIDAYWTTKLDDLGDPSTTKTVKKRNIGVVAMPFSKSSAQIYYLKDTEEKLAKEYSLSSEFRFDEIDFDNINFGLSSSPYFVPTNKKAKNNKMFRIKIRNAHACEAFGIYKIVFNYEYAKAIKR